MTMPSHLKLVGRDISVKTVDDCTDQLGGCDFETQTIFIKSGQKKYLEADTLVHECLHFIDELFQLDVTERQVYCIAVALMALFKDNPQMLEYIKESINSHD